MNKQNDLENNDIEGKFYVLPNDNIDSTSNAISKLIFDKDILYNKLNKIRYYFEIAIKIIVVITIIILFSIFIKIYSSILSKLPLIRRNNTPEILPLEQLI